MWILTLSVYYCNISCLAPPCDKKPLVYYLHPALKSTVYCTFWITTVNFCFHTSIDFYSSCFLLCNSVIFIAGTNSYHMTVTRHDSAELSLLNTRYYLCSSLQQIPTVAQVKPHTTVKYTFFRVCWLFYLNVLRHYAVKRLRFYS